MPSKLNTPPAVGSAPAWINYIPAGLASYALLGGIVTLLGWFLGIYRLTDWEGKGIAMKANTAVAAIACSAALLVVAFRPPSRWIIRLLGIFTALVGGLTLLENITVWNLGIDTLLVNEAPGMRATSSPGRMGVPASTSFLLIGTALLLFAQGGRARSLVPVLGMITTAIGTLSLVGFLYAADQLYALPRLTGIAMQTASMLLALGLALLASVPERQPMQTLLEPSAAGVLARRILPLIVLLPLVLGWFRVWIQQRGLVDTAFGTALRTVVEIALLIGLLWWAAASVRTHEQALSRNRELWRITLMSIGDAVITTDSSGRVTFLNTVAEFLTGWKNDRAVGETLETIFHVLNETTREPVNNPATKALKEGVIVGRANHTLLVATDGTERAIDDNAAPIRDEQGNIIGCVLVFRDVTERRRDERALRRSEHNLRDFFDNATIGLHWVGPDGIILRANQTELNLLGYQQEEYVGRPITEFHADSDVIAEILQCLSAGKALNQYAARLKCKDGSIKDVLINSNVLWEEGRFIHTRCFTVDVTERKKAEEALRLAQSQLHEHARRLETRVAERTAELRATTEQLEAFVYSIAHDLRAPLRSTTSFSQLLLDDHAAQLNETGRNFLKRIQNASEFMDKLLLDLLAYGSTSRASMELGPVEVEKAWASAVFQNAALAEESGAQLRVVRPLPAVHANETTLGQCLANLLSNAIKFVAPGVQPEIRFWCEEFTPPADESGTRIRLWMEDNGIGMAPEHQERVFRVFERLHGTRYPGTGIGLSIVRKGVERMGGRVGLESLPGQGNRFWIDLRKA